jgi:hypothetical protein
MIWGQIGPQKLTNNKKSHELSWLFAFTGRNGGVPTKTSATPSVT